MTRDNMQICSQFDSKGGCRNPSETVRWDRTFYPLDFCAKHNHMMNTGIVLKCWRCGDDRIKGE